MISAKQLLEQLDFLRQSRLQLLNTALMTDGAIQVCEHLLKLEEESAPKPANVVEMPARKEPSNAS